MKRWSQFLMSFFESLPNNFVANAFLDSEMSLNFHSIKSFQATADSEFRDDDRVLKIPSEKQFKQLNIQIISHQRIFLTQVYADSTYLKAPLNMTATNKPGKPGVSRALAIK